MVRRWIIRGFFVALCVVCVGVWAGSYFGLMGLFAKLGGHTWGFRAVQGLGGFDELPRVLIPRPIFQFAFRQGESAKDWNHGPTTVGFYCGPVPGFVDSFTFMIIFPLWFPTLLSALLLWLVWRKTRPKVVGKAFPVEPASAKAIQ